MTPVRLRSWPLHGPGDALVAGQADEAVQARHQIGHPWMTLRVRIVCQDNNCGNPLGWVAEMMEPTNPDCGTSRTWTVSPAVINVHQDVHGRTVRHITPFPCGAILQALVEPAWRAGGSYAHLGPLQRADDCLVLLETESAKLLPPRLPVWCPTSSHRGTVSLDAIRNALAVARRTGNVKPFAVRGMHPSPP